MRFLILIVSAAAAVGLIVSGCATVDCSELTLETDFEAGSACFEDYERPAALDIAQLSTADSSIRHNNGRNCMSCHQSAGPGKGQFTAAGTVYKVDGSMADPGSIVGIYADPDRQVVIAELEVDQLGNVYTTGELGLSESKRFVSVWSADRQLRSDMRSPKFNLSCNFCHDAAFQVELDPATDTVQPAPGDDDDDSSGDDDDSSGDDDDSSGDDDDSSGDDDDSSGDDDDSAS